MGVWLFSGGWIAMAFGIDGEVMFGGRFGGAAD